MACLAFKGASVVFALSLQPHCIAALNTFMLAHWSRLFVLFQSGDSDQSVPTSQSVNGSSLVVDPSGENLSLSGGKRSPSPADIDLNAMMPTGETEASSSPTSADSSTAEWSTGPVGTTQSRPLLAADENQDTGRNDSSKLEAKTQQAAFSAWHSLTGPSADAMMPIRAVSMPKSVVTGDDLSSKMSVSMTQTVPSSHLNGPLVHLLQPKVTTTAPQEVYLQQSMQSMPYTAGSSNLASQELLVSSTMAAKSTQLVTQLPTAQGMPAAHLPQSVVPPYNIYPAGSAQPVQHMQAAVLARQQQQQQSQLVQPGSPREADLASYRPVEFPLAHGSDPFSGLTSLPLSSMGTALGSAGMPPAVRGVMPLSSIGNTVFINPYPSARGPAPTQPGAVFHAQPQALPPQVYAIPSASAFSVLPQQRPVPGSVPSAYMQPVHVPDQRLQATTQYSHHPGLHSGQQRRPGARQHSPRMSRASQSSSRPPPAMRSNSPSSVATPAVSASLPAAHQPGQSKQARDTKTPDQTAS